MPVSSQKLDFSNLSLFLFTSLISQNTYEYIYYIITKTSIAIRYNKFNLFFLQIIAIFPCLAVVPALPFHMAVAERDNGTFAVTFGEHIVVNQKIAVVRGTARAFFQKQRAGCRILRGVNGLCVQFGIDAVRIVVVCLFRRTAIDFHGSDVGEKRAAFDVEKPLRRAWEILIADPAAIDAAADRALRREREMATVVIGIHGDGQREVLLVVEAVRLLRLLPRLAQGGHEHRRQNGDDGDDDQQFNQCKKISVLHGAFFTRNSGQRRSGDSPPLRHCKL